MSNYVVIGVIAVLVLIGVIILIVKVSDRRKQTELYQQKIADLQERIKDLMSRADKSEDNTTKRIIENHLAYLIVEEAKERLTPLMEKTRKKIQRRPSPDDERLLKQYEDELAQKKEKAANIYYFVDDELTEAENEAYAKVSSAFSALSHCNKVWSILSETPITSYKSSARKNITRSEIRLRPQPFDRLFSKYDIPVFPCGRGNIYLYPRFALVAKDIQHLEVLPVSYVKMEWGQTRFIENEGQPFGAEQVGTTHTHVNRDGTPDRRFAHNAALPIMLYGTLDIRPFRVSYMFSKYTPAANFQLSFSLLQKAVLDSENNIQQTPGSIIDTNDDSIEKVNNVLKMMGSSPVPCYRGITPAYFEEARSITGRINDFGSILADRNDFVKIVDKTINGDVTFNGQKLTDPQKKIRFYLLGDVLHCYNGLGHKIDMNKPEGLGLLLYCIDWMTPNTVVDYERLPLFYAKVGKTVENMLVQMNNSIKNESGLFLLEYCLREYDVSLHNQYVSLLHLFATVITKADRTASATETAWLKSIAQLKIDTQDGVKNG